MEMYMMKGNDVDDENDEYDVCVCVFLCVNVCVCEVFDATCGMYTRVMHYWLDTVAFALPPTLGEDFHSPVRMPFTRHQISGFLGANGEYFGHHWASLDSK